jgi:hypothetical protein
LGIVLNLQYSEKIMFKINTWWNATQSWEQWNQFLLDLKSVQQTNPDFTYYTDSHPEWFSVSSLFSDGKLNLDDSRLQLLISENSEAEAFYNQQINSGFLNSLRKYIIHIRKILD